ncbi:MAG: 16S rRNA (cytosine(967)-C(5))-methyltransferase RsmB [Pseudomonadota bacterium]
MPKTPRYIALEILNKVEKEGGHADEVIGNSFKAEPELSYQEKAFITELVYGVLRWKYTIDWVLKQFSTSPNRRISRHIRNLLRIGIYQVLYLTHIPIPVLVNATVNLAKELTNEKIASLVNGLLRTVERKREAIRFPSFEENPAQAIAIRYSHPVWLVEKWLHQLGAEETISLCKVNNTPPPFTIRTNILKVTREKLREYLTKEGLVCEATEHSPDGIIISHPADVTRLASFQKGWFFVQDEAAQLISYLVNPRSGEAILDLCAAPGGKTTHLAQLMNNQGQIVAVDVRFDRFLLLKENQSRLGITVIKPVLADATQWFPLQDHKKFDKVLLDAPCSGLGVLRRHPEGKWSKSWLMVNRLKKTQLTMIQNASHYVTLGGVMVYSTCALNAEENEQIVEQFLLQTGNEFQIENPLPYLPSQDVPFINSRGYFQTFPHRDSMDGFFAVRLRRVA